MQVKAKVALAAGVALMVLSAFFAGWQIQTVPTAKPDSLFQLAAFNTFAQGNYSGIMTYAELSEHGDFGIGTFDGLDGEMIALEGVFFQVPSSGVPQEASSTQTAPYATLTFFDADQTFTVSNMAYTQLKTAIDSQLPSSDAIYAIKIHGTYTYAQTRSPEKQALPYPDINDALKTQAVFNLTEASATAVGFYFPRSLDGVDYAGYHLHLITDDHTAGGHLLDCVIDKVTVELDQINSYNLILP
jgi:acetolactate decarboxylase